MYAVQNRQSTSAAAYLNVQIYMSSLLNSLVMKKPGEELSLPGRVKLFVFIYRS
jgi:hypothetical protein